MKEKCRTWGWASVGGDEWLEITNSDPLRCQRQSRSSSSRHLPSDSRVVPMPPSAQHQLLVQELSVATLSSRLGCSGAPVQLCGPPKPPAVQPQQWAASASSLPEALVGSVSSLCTAGRKGLRRDLLTFLVKTAFCEMISFVATSDDCVLPFQCASPRRAWTLSNSWLGCLCTVHTWTDNVLHVGKGNSIFASDCQAACIYMLIGFLTEENNCNFI